MSALFYLSSALLALFASSTPLSISSDAAHSVCEFDTLALRTIQYDNKYIYHASYEREIQVFYETNLPASANEVELFLDTNVTCTYSEGPQLNTLVGEKVGVVDGGQKTIWLFKQTLQGRMGSRDYLLRSNATLSYKIGGRSVSCTSSDGERFDKPEKFGGAAMPDPHVQTYASAFHGTSLLHVPRRIMTADPLANDVLPILFNPLCEGSQLEIVFVRNDFQTIDVYHANIADKKGPEGLTLRLEDVFPGHGSFKFYVVLKTCGLVIRDDNFGKYFVHFGAK